MDCETIAFVLFSVPVWSARYMPGTLFPGSVCTVLFINELSVVVFVLVLCAAVDGYEMCAWGPPTWWAAPWPCPWAKLDYPPLEMKFWCAALLLDWLEPENIEFDCWERGGTPEPIAEPPMPCARPEPTWRVLFCGLELGWKAFEFGWWALEGWPIAPPVPCDILNIGFICYYSCQCVFSTIF